MKGPDATYIRRIIFGHNGARGGYGPPVFFSAAPRRRPLWDLGLVAKYLVDGVWTSDEIFSNRFLNSETALNNYATAGKTEFWIEDYSCVRHTGF
ncbi:hypothetical protein K0M31_012255 [Melipona bicolor]|uniref:Uncharacterized protein n=1 Tax=Melipona bicolor TaxID=60889 RepID=A0AA40FKN3_9HYME|nr:hypothetical protein K0M31_012255 [Melipona bicolor]